MNKLSFAILSEEIGHFDTKRVEGTILEFKWSSMLNFIETSQLCFWLVTLMNDNFILGFWLCVGGDWFSTCILPVKRSSFICKTNPFYLWTALLEVLSYVKLKSLYLWLLLLIHYVGIIWGWIKIRPSFFMLSLNWQLCHCPPSHLSLPKN